PAAGPHSSQLLLGADLDDLGRRDAVALHDVQFFGMELGARVLDRDQLLRVPLASPDGVEPVRVAVPPRLEPLVRREHHFLLVVRATLHLDPSDLALPRRRVRLADATNVEPAAVVQLPNLEGLAV